MGQAVAKPLRQVGIREMKAQLSRLVREVKQGATVVVTEHGRPVARLVPEPVSLEERENVVKLPVSEVVLDRAALMAWRNGLRGYDAVHPATALEWEQAGGDGAMVLATFDRQLADAGLGCGLTIWPRQEQLAGGGR